MNFYDETGMKVELKIDENIRYWLDRYQEPLRPLLNDYGYGLLYVNNISSAALINYYRSEKYYSNVGVLFQENDYDIVVSEITKAVKDVLENHLDNDNGNKICFTILYGGEVTGGFGIWVVKQGSKHLDRIINSDNPRAIGMLM